MKRKPATLWTKVKALWSKDARQRIKNTKRHTREWEIREGSIPDEELPERFPFAKQNKN